MFLQPCFHPRNVRRMVKYLGSLCRARTNSTGPSCELPFIRDTFYHAFEMTSVRTYCPDHSTNAGMLSCTRIEVGIGDSRPDNSNLAVHARWVCAPAVGVHRTISRKAFGLTVQFLLVQRSDKKYSRDMVNQPTPDSGG